jgi:hypothetical protein
VREGHRLLSCSRDVVFEVWVNEFRGVMPLPSILDVKVGIKRLYVQG